MDQPKKRGAGKNMTQDEFIAKARTIHMTKERTYDYSNVVHINSRKKVLIGCLNNPQHGIFEQMLAEHLSGKGLHFTIGCFLITCHSAA